MTDITLTPITSGYNLQKINDNFDKIEEAINEEVVHNKGGNNVMNQDLDMNSNKVLNVPAPTEPGDLVRLQDIPTGGGGGGGEGEANTTSNEGVGVGLALPKVLANLPFKSIVAGANVSITEGISDITISATSGGGGGAAAYESVAAMVIDNPSIGTEVRTLAYYLGASGGSAFYVIKSSAQAAADGDVVDEYTNITLLSGAIAVLQADGEVDFRMVGGRQYINDIELDNKPALLAADAQGHTIVVVGSYFFADSVDLGLGVANLRSQVIGVENTNFDSFAASRFVFRNTDGLRVYAGAKVHDLEIQGIGGKVGTGFTADNVHLGDFKNITCTNWTRGFNMFLWTSVADSLLSYQCTLGMELYGECTSTTYRSCYMRDGTTGYRIGGGVTYSTFMNCAVDDCDVPYEIRGGSNVDFNNCGAEINHKDILGFFKFTGEEPSTISISGGRYIMGNHDPQAPDFLTESIVYYPDNASQTFGNILVTRMNLNSFSNPTLGFVKGKGRVVIGDDCAFSDVLNLRVAEGSFGSIMMDGVSSGALRRYAKKRPSVGASQTIATVPEANRIPNQLAITIEEVIDFQQAIDDNEVVFVKFFGVDADSQLQLKVELYPMTGTGTGSPYTYQHFEGWGYGSSQAFGTNITGTAFDFKLNDANGYQNFYIKRSAIQGKAFVRVTATGWPDPVGRDRLVTLTVGPDDA